MIHHLLRVSDSPHRLFSFDAGPLGLRPGAGNYKGAGMQPPNQAVKWPQVTYQLFFHTVYKENHATNHESSLSASYRVDGRGGNASFKVRVLCISVPSLYE